MNRSIEGENISTTNFTFREKGEVVYDPVAVASQTFDVLENYLAGGYDGKEELLYLATDTKAYVRRAQRGIHMDFTARARFSQAEFRRFIATAESAAKSTTPEEDRHAFQHAVVIMSLLPEYFDIGFYSRNGRLTPPRDRFQFMDRLNEIDEVLAEFLGLKVSPGTNPETDASLLRTYAFFKVSKDIPLKYGLSKKEVKDLLAASRPLLQEKLEADNRSREQFDKLLRDTKIDLD